MRRRSAGPGARGAVAALVALSAACDAAGERGADGGIVDAAGAMDAGAADAVPDRDAAPATDGVVDAAAPDGPPAADGGVRDAAPVDAGDAGEPPAPPPRHLDLGRHAPGEVIGFTVPPGYTGVLLQAVGAPDGLYAIVDVVGPAGRLVGPVPHEDAPLRTSYNPEVAVALLPNGDGPALVPGEYRFRIRADRHTDPMPVEAWLTAGGDTLRVNLLLPPATGRRPDDPAVEAMARALEDQLAAHFELARVEAAPALLDETAPPELVIDSRAGDLSGLGVLAAAATGEYGEGVDVYLVDQIRDGEHRQGGFTGGLPAPMALRGTAASVVAIRTSLLDDFPDAVADLAAHEIGHALGLYHTTEPYGDRHDPLADTPECPRTCDADGDGLVGARDCGARGTREPPCRGTADNLMFWTLGGERRLTEGQRRVARRHPLVAAP